MDLECAFHGDRPAVTIIEGWALCKICKDFVLSRNLRSATDGRLVVFKQEN